MNILNIAKGFIVKNKLFFIAGAAFLSLFLLNRFNYNRYVEQKKENARLEINIRAANDTIRLVRDKAGKDEYNKYSYLVKDIQDLKKTNMDLYNVIKDIKGNVNTVVKSDIQIKEVPTPFIVKAELKDSTVTTHFNFDTIYSEKNYKKLAGYTKYNLKTDSSYGEKTVDEIGISLVTGIKNLDKGKPEIFVKSDYPGLTVTGLDGAILDNNLFIKPKPKKRVISIGGSVGWTPLVYENKQFNFNPQRIGATLGVNFNLLELLRK